jgi:hypothetical protein
MEEILVKKKKLIEINKAQCQDMNHLKFVENSQCQIMPQFNESFG